MKFKLKPVVKYCEGDKYIFIGGVAKVPNMWHKGFNLPYTITLKEFKEIMEN